MIKKFEHFLGFRNISYSGIILDKESHEILINEFKDIIPPEWNIYAHHMTICIGELPTIYRDYREEEVELKVTHYGINENVIAVRVDGFFTLSRGKKEIVDDRTPHITLAVKPGEKSIISNELSDWIEIKPFKIKGIVKEIEGSD